MRGKDIKAGGVYQYCTSDKLALLAFPEIYDRETYKVQVVDAEPVHRPLKELGFSLTGTFAKSERADGVRVVFLPRDDISRLYDVPRFLPRLSAPNEHAPYLYDGTDENGRDIYRVQLSKIRATWDEYQEQRSQQIEAENLAEEKFTESRTDAENRLDRLPPNIQPFFAVNRDGTIRMVMQGGTEGLLEAIESLI